MEAAPEQARNRGPVTACIMLATIMQVLDTTIANVALPHMQGSLSASLDQIEWVLTSYIVVAAIMTPPTGWLTARFGRKRLMLICIVGFTVASGLCGLATSLGQIVGFRMLQGFFGAAIVPLGQAMMLDIYPKERHGAAMAMWSTATTLAPILGPTLGGWLTQNYSWRWVFYINVPLGVVACLGIVTFLSESRREKGMSLDWFGFGLLSLAIGAFQLMLDRGQELDWFGSTEIVTEAVLAALAFYLFVVHTVTSDAPFVKPSLFRDRTYVIGILLIFMNAGVVFAVMALMTPFLQNLTGYSVIASGILQAPRAMASCVSFLLIGRLITLVDLRLLMLFGLSLTVIGFWQMTGFTADISMTTLVVNGMIQGFGVGFIFVPLTTFTFGTLAPRDRAEGTAVYALMRNLGTSVAISVVTALLTTNIQRNHADIARYVTPTNPLFRVPAIARFWNPHLPSGLVSLDQEVVRQATTIAFIDDFKALMIVAMISMPLLFFVRTPRQAPTEVPAMAME